MATPPVFTAGQVLTAAQMNAVGTWLIKSQTIGTTVSSVTVTDAFSADYVSYRIIVSGGVGSAQVALRMTLGPTATGYYWAGQAITFAAAASANGSGANAAAWDVARGSTVGVQADIQIHEPFSTKETWFSSAGLRMTTDGYPTFNGGYLANSTSYTAFTLTPASGTLTGGIIRVFGIRD